MREFDAQSPFNGGRVRLRPTQGATAFLLVLAAMLLGSINYHSSSAYALTFLIAGLAVVSIVHSHRNLSGLRFHITPPRPAFVGQSAEFSLRIDNPRNQPRYAITVAALDSATVCDLAAMNQQSIFVPVAADHRGLLPLGTITVSSQFPFGLVRAWICLHPPHVALIYPRPEASGPSPTIGSAPEEANAIVTDEEFADLRPYRDGDPPRRIHWKALAKEQGLLIREYQAATAAPIWLDWNQLTELHSEQRIERLCRWVLEAERQGIDYGLKVPGLSIGQGRGPRHRHGCLQALALLATDA